MKLMETYGDMVKDTNDHFEELGQRLRSSDAIKNELFSQVDMLGKEKMALSTRVNELEGDIELLKISNGDLREEREILLRRSSEVSSSSVSTTSFRALVWKGVYKINKERFEKEKGKLASEIKFNLSRKEEYKKQANTFMIENNTTKQKLAKIQSEMATLKRSRVDLEEVATKAVEKVVKKLRI
jgi:chromosome segregation ATPase